MDFIANSLRGVKKKPEEVDQETLRARAEKELLDNLYNNYNIFFDTMVLGQSVRRVDYVDLLRGLCHNTTVRYVTLELEFMNNLRGDEVRILLEVIGGMPKLETLTIHFLPELAMTPVTLADFLRRAKSTLKELHLFNLELAGDDYDMEPLAEVLESLTLLTKVSFNKLGIVELEDEDRDPITPDLLVNAVANLPALEEISMSSRHDMAWDEDSLGGLCESKTLKVLKINNIQLDDGQVAAIASALQENATMQHLELSKCGVDDNGWKAIASFLPDNKTLEVLNLSQSPALNDDGCFVVGSCIETNTSLKILQLQNEGSSEVTSQGISTLFRTLEKNTTLECIEVSFTAKDDRGFKSVADALSRNNTLKQMYIENHAAAVSTKGIVAIGSALESNTSLEKIGIIFDGEDSEGVLALAQAMQKSSSLKHFAFNNSEYHSAKKDEEARRPSIMGLNLG